MWLFSGAMPALMCRSAPASRCPGAWCGWPSTRPVHAGWSTAVATSSRLILVQLEGW